jgi:hypothetical protein
VKNSKKSQESDCKADVEARTSTDACDAAPAREDQPSDVSRRTFLGTAVVAGAAGALASGWIAPRRAQAQDALAIAAPLTSDEALLLEPDAASALILRQSPGERRRDQSFLIRVQAARQNRALPVPTHPNNGDELRYPNRIASYSKGLPHNQFGEVDLAAYDALLKAVASGRPEDFEAIPSGNSDLATRVKLTNPQSGLAFDLQGTDAQQLTTGAVPGFPGAAFAPAPAFDSAEEAGEILENYWMALLRDVPFEDYPSNALAQEAAAELSRIAAFKGPRVGGAVTPRTLFRENLPGALAGPYLSQFFLLAQPFGAQFVEPRVRTTLPSLDFMTQPAEWLRVQNGIPPSQSSRFDPVLRYMRNGRDLSEWVHVDVLFQAYFQSMLTLLQPPNSADPQRSGLGAPVNPGNPYNSSRNQIGFGTFGGPFIAQIVCEVATRALKAVWYQKWFVHRRLRPEVYAGRVHHFMFSGRNYPIRSEVLNSRALQRVVSRSGTAFLPMAFPEGSPTHPAYGAGHATVAGACVTVLKAVFDESFILPRDRLRVPTAEGGLAPYPSTFPDLTLGGELNKIAANVALGRNIAGVHWRSDGTESLKLGESVAISILRDQRLTYNERFAGYTFTKFDGTRVTV